VELCKLANEAMLAGGAASARGEIGARHHRVMPQEREQRSLERGGQPAALAEVDDMQGAARRVPARGLTSEEPFRSLYAPDFFCRCLVQLGRSSGRNA
jgi:hypothetical protein